MGQRTVLFFGAGASRALGYPLTSQILPRIVSGLNDGSLFVKNNVVAPVLGEHAMANAAGFLPDATSVLRDELVKLFPGILVEVPPPQITDILSLLDHLIITGTSAVPGSSALPVAGVIKGPPETAGTTGLLGFNRERLARVRGLLERAVA